MSCLFDAIKFEIMNPSTTDLSSSDWVDVTADVLINPHPAWNRGIMGNKQDDRVGHSGFLTFALDNSAYNAARLAGYYSPGHANCWSGFATGLLVRLSFTFDSTTFYKYSGRIRPDYGIEVEPWTKGGRKTFINCGDFMWRAQQHELKGLTYAANQNIGQLVTAVIANMPIPPLATSIDTGIETFPAIFDMAYMRTTALAEFAKGAMSEFSNIYVIGDKTGGETLRVENKTTRSNKQTKVSIPTSQSTIITDESGDPITDESGNNLLVDDVQNASFDNTMSVGMQVGYGKTRANRINAYVYPRRIDAAATTILYSLEKSFKLEPSETLSNFRCAYRDPTNLATQVSGKDMVQPPTTDNYAATANEDGTGANMTSDLTVTATYGTESVIYDLANGNGGSALWIQQLDAVGKGIYTYDPIQSMRESTTDQYANGIISLSLDFKYLTDVRKAQWNSEYILGREKSPRSSIDACPIWANKTDVNMLGFLQLEPGEKATFIETQSGISGDYFINGYSAEIYNGKHVLWTPILKADPDFLGIWVTRASASNNQWHSVCWSPELSMFAAVAYAGTSDLDAGSSDRVITSPDGIVWTSRASPSAVDNQWRGVCWSPALGMFAAVSASGSSDRVMTSTDGTTWVSRISAADNNWYSVCWSPGLSMFCAVSVSGTSDRVMTSIDGITWATRVSAADNNWTSVCWSPELTLFVAVANAGTSDRVMTSTDGIAWTSRASAADNEWYSVCWSPELLLFCAVARSGTGNRVMTSTDGISWVSRVAAADNEWTSVCWSPELSMFCAVANNDAGDTGNLVMASTDGITWTSKASAADNDWASICWSPELSMFVAVSYSGTGNRVMTSK